jgi:DNA invertase Pin-like site-specific DNA recombinase
MEAINPGLVEPGDALLVESVDRISRQAIDEGYDLCQQILRAGVHIITMEPERDFGPQVILERAPEESQMNSARRQYGWKKKREQARAGGKALRKTRPAWLEVTADGFREKKAEAAVVRRIFTLCREGMGAFRIVTTLERESVPLAAADDDHVLLQAAQILLQVLS